MQRRGRLLPLFFSDLILLSSLLGSIRFRVGDGVRIEIRVWLGLGFRSLFFFPEFDSRVRVRLHVPRSLSFLFPDPDRSGLFLTPDMMYI